MTDIYKQVVSEYRWAAVKTKLATTYTLMENIAGEPVVSFLCDKNIMLQVHIVLRQLKTTLW
jgi:uncharacterized protein YbcI